MLFVFVINLKISVSAKVDVMEIDVNSPLVSEEKIYELNQQYHAGTMDKKDIYFLYENSVRIFGSVPEPIVVMDGLTDWNCQTTVGNGSGTYRLSSIVLEHKFTGETIELNESKEVLDDYFSRTKKISEEIRENVQYILENMSEEEYGGMFYNEKNGKICIYVLTETSQELEEKGYQCIQAKYSLSELYERLRELWKNREEYGINYIKINYSENGLDIYSFKELDDSCYEKNDRIFIAYMLHPGNCYFSTENQKVIEDTQILNMFDATAFTEVQDEKVQNNIHEGIMKLQETYVGYDIRNLLNRIAVDGNYDRYLEFDEEILAFVDTLPEYVQNEKNPVEEMMFGDSERIELKSLLKEYKSIYLDMSYAEIYETYLSKWEETDANSREIKLYQLAMERKQGIFSQTNKQRDVEYGETKEGNDKTTVICIIALFAEVVVMLMIKRRKVTI